MFGAEAETLDGMICGEITFETGHGPTSDDVSTRIGGGIREKYRNRFLIGTHFKRSKNGNFHGLFKNKRT